MHKQTPKGSKHLPKGNRRYTMNTLALSDFNNFLVGFDRLQRSFLNGSSQVEYPRFNLVKIDDDEYKIEIALAGWNKKDIEVVHSRTDAKLTIKGKKQLSDEKDSYLHKGISGKSFIRDFALAEHVVVENAEFTDGLLTVILKVEIPKEQQPTSITIN